MDKNKVETFIKLAGGKIPSKIDFVDGKTQELGARILLSEVLEYIIYGLGLKLSVNGTVIDNPEGIEYSATGNLDPVAAIDGIADIAYTMYWNAARFGLPIEEAFNRVADNNLEKFVKVDDKYPEGDLQLNDWHCDLGVSWTPEVVKVEIIKIGAETYAVGKDSGGKVRKPSTYKSVVLDDLVTHN